MVPKFMTYDEMSDSFDHIMYYRQLMTLDIRNDALLCKVFSTSLHDQTFSWFHCLSKGFMDNFWDLSKAFMGHYLCSTCHKQNINTLQNIKMQENESLRDFVKWFGQVVLQVEPCSIYSILQIFKRSIFSGMPFFESLTKKPPPTMDDLFRRAKKYLRLEDDVNAATQQVLVANRPTRNDHAGSQKPSNQLRQASKRRDDQQQPNQVSLTPLSISYEKNPPNDPRSV